MVNFTAKLYKKGVQVTGKAKRALEAQFQRSPTLRWWNIFIQPRRG